MLRGLTLTITAAAGVAALSGCWESSEVTLHEPGTYMGRADPLMEQDPAARADQLKERFQMVQIDR